MLAVKRSMSPGGTPSGNNTEWHSVVFHESVDLYVHASDGSLGPRREGRKKNFALSSAGNTIVSVGNCLGRE
jgi:hypothetical protein